jgi:hypothetical protein
VGGEEWQEKENWWRRTLLYIVVICWTLRMLWSMEKGEKGLAVNHK